MKYYTNNWIITILYDILYFFRSIYNDFPELAHKKIFEQHDDNENKNAPKESRLSQILSWFKGWKLYMTYPVRNAGLGLACLYMTVLGFDNITYGFCLQQCVTESVLGALIGVSALVGVTGSISFPFIRKCIGLSKTGIFGFISLLSCLSLCLLSIFLNGSPFDPNYYYQEHYDNNNQTNDGIIHNETMGAKTDLDDCVTSSYLSVGILLAGKNIKII